MGKLKKKGESGAAVNYITRNQAIKKLQVSLADFRRLCILKGIYPREPRNKKKAAGGSSAPKTFYYSKDIQYLLHEPLVQKFREWKTFSRKLAKVLAKGQYSTAKSLEEHSKPTYTLDHIVKERYPSFIDAIRDLDDCLCLVFLFASMPETDKLPIKRIRQCQRLTQEFMRWVVETKALRKAFFSIKGVYYRAEIMGQSVTWLVPYKFVQKVPADVDLRVMLTFFEFYETMLGFVNYKLYSDAGFLYPPKVNDLADSSDLGINSLLLEPLTKEGGSINLIEEKPQASIDRSIIKKQKAESEKRLESLKANLSKLIGEDATATVDEEEETSAGAAAASSMEMTVDEFPINQEDEQNGGASGKAGVATGDVLQKAATVDKLTSLFSGLVFFLSREIPRDSIEFLLRSFGGKVGFAIAGLTEKDTAKMTVIGPNGQRLWKESDKDITHQIVDRPLPSESMLWNREYIQPQWIVDCINAGKLLDTAPYRPGQKLPPHLSPFVEAKAGDYVPLGGGVGGGAAHDGDDDDDQPSGPIADKDDASDEDDEDGRNEMAEAGKMQEDEDEDGDDDDIKDDDDDDDDDDDMEVESKKPAKKSAAAATSAAKAKKGDGKSAASASASASASVGASKKKDEKKSKSIVKDQSKSGKISKPTHQISEEEEAKQLAMMMMSRKDRRLYDKIQYGKRKKEEQVTKLTSRRKQAAAATTATATK